MCQKVTPVKTTAASIKRDNGNNLAASKQPAQNTPVETTSSAPVERHVATSVTTCDNGGWQYQMPPAKIDPKQYLGSDMRQWRLAISDATALAGGNRQTCRSNAAPALAVNDATTVAKFLQSEREPRSRTPTANETTANTNGTANRLNRERDTSNHATDTRPRRTHTPGG